MNPYQQPPEAADAAAPSSYINDVSTSDLDALADKLAPNIERLVNHLVEEKLEARLDELTARSGPEPLWSVKDVADYLNVSVRTVETIIARGRLRPLKVKGQRRFEPGAVQAYARSSHWPS